MKNNNAFNNSSVAKFTKIENAKSYALRGNRMSRLFVMGDFYAVTFCSKTSAEIRKAGYKQISVLG